MAQAPQTGESPSFGQLLRELRERHGMTQVDLSASSGISQSTVSALETGKQRPWPSTRRALAEAFKMDLETFDDLVLPKKHLPDTPRANAERGAMGEEGSGTVLRLVQQVHALEDRLARAEQEVALLRRVLDRVPIVMWTTDENLRVTSATGWAEARHERWLDAVGQPLDEYLRSNGAATDADQPLAAHRRALEGESTSYTCEWDGHRWEVVVEPLKRAANEHGGTIGVAVARVNGRG